MKIKKFFISLALVGILLLPMVALAQVSDPSATNYGMDYTEDIGIGNTELIDLIKNIIRIILGLLGLIAVILILYAGFLWMTAAGNDDQIGKAKSIITAAVIGIVVIFAAWAIAEFVISRIVEATGA